MPLQPGRRLPKKFSRRASKRSKALVQKRRKHHSRLFRERFRRMWRQFLASVKSYQQSALQWTLIGVAALIILCIGLVLFSPIVHVREIQIKRLSPRLDIEEVQEALSPLFDRHLFFVSSFDVSQLLREKIYDLNTVSINKTYPSVLHVNIKLDPLVARLRIEDPDLMIPNPSASGSIMEFLTENGAYVWTIAAENTDTLPLLTIVDWGARPQPGDVILDPLMLERMAAAEISLLRQFGQEVWGRTVFLRAQEFHLHTDDGMSIWFDMRSPLQEQLERYRTFLRAVQLDDVQQYIDVRVEDRVIYQ